MQVRALVRLATAASAAALISGVVVLPGSTFAASADPVQNLLTGGAPHAIYLVKDLGGGAYWNVTTQTMYALEAGSEILVSGAQTTADLFATLAANGRDLLLLINGAVLVPVQEALGG
jgi:hypothetical protein